MGQFPHTYIAFLHNLKLYAISSYVILKYVFAKYCSSLLYFMEGTK